MVSYNFRDCRGKSCQPIAPSGQVEANYPGRAPCGQAHHPRRHERAWERLERSVPPASANTARSPAFEGASPTNQITPKKRSLPQPPCRPGRAAVEQMSGQPRHLAMCDFKRAEGCSNPLLNRRLMKTCGDTLQNVPGRQLPSSQQPAGLPAMLIPGSRNTWADDHDGGRPVAQRTCCGRPWAGPMPQPRNIRKPTFPLEGRALRSACTRRLVSPKPQRRGVLLRRGAVALDSKLEAATNLAAIHRGGRFFLGTSNALDVSNRNASAEIGTHSASMSCTDGVGRITVPKASAEPGNSWRMRCRSSLVCCAWQNKSDWPGQRWRPCPDWHNDGLRLTGMLDQHAHLFGMCLATDCVMTPFRQEDMVPAEPGIADRPPQAAELGGAVSPPPWLVVLRGHSPCRAGFNQPSGRIDELRHILSPSTLTSLRCHARMLENPMADACRPQRC